MTARHCIGEVVAGGESTPDAFHLLLVYARGQWLEHYKVQSFAFPDKDFPSFDVALLTLASASRIMSLNILALSPVVGETFTQVGYEAGLPHVVNVHGIYVFLVSLQNGVWCHSCGPNPVSSGGLRIVFDEGRYNVAAINFVRTASWDMASNVL